jgi:polysaccharide export outer membrane protein
MAVGLGLAACAVCLGCQGTPLAPPAEFPRELTPVSLPEYRIAPPDVLALNTIRTIPRPPYLLEPLDAISVNVTNTLPDYPIAGIYVIEPDGTVHLGARYGSVKVADLTTDQAQKAITEYLKLHLKPPYQVTVGLAQGRAQQFIRGDHLVRPDGSIGLGIYGNVRVAGLTLDEAKTAIEAHLSQYLLKPEISVDVSGFNHQVFYVIFERPAVGEQAVRLPITGNETVLDALSQVGGLAPVSAKRHIWVARPCPNVAGYEQILPVDWIGITERGSTETNYQLLPGDRIYVQASTLVKIDIALARFLSPFERILGITLLGSETIHNIAIPLGQSTSGGSGSGG